jgi:hypothetical protein
MAEMPVHYKLLVVETGGILTGNAEDFDIVSTLWKHRAVL